MSDYTGGPDADTFNGTDEPDVAHGGEGNDRLIGGGGDDFLYGEGGDDSLWGGPGKDSIFGGAGNDFILYGVGLESEAGESIDGGDGWDVVRGRGFGMDLSQTTMTAIEAVDGAGFGTTLLTSAQFDQLLAASGEFRLTDAGIITMAGVGSALAAQATPNTLVINVSNDGNWIDFTGYVSNGLTQVIGRAGNDRIVGGDGAEDFAGGAGNDFVTGGGGDDRLAGGAGIDTVDGGTGNDILVLSEDLDARDILDGGEGFDLVQLASFGAVVDLTKAALTNIEGIDAVSGLAKLSLAQLDAMRAISGNFLLTTAGTISLADFAPASNAADSISFTLADGTNSLDMTSFGGWNASAQGGAGADTIVGHGGYNALTGGGGDDVLDGRGGGDFLDGGAGDDRFFVDSSDDLVIEAAGGGNDVVLASASFALRYGAEIETLRTQDDFGTAAIDFTGNDLANTLVGNAGANRLDGRGGDDRLQGGDGNDLLYSGEGSDALSGGAGNDGMYFGASFGAGDAADGGSGTDSLAIQGNYVGLTLAGVANVEVLLVASASDIRFGGWGGSFSYQIASIDSNIAAGSRLTVSANGLNPSESLAFDGSAETDGAFRIFAGQGVDTLKGGAGNDGFFFGADNNLTGADRLDGGAGIDSLALRGNYAGTKALAFQPASFTGIEVLTFLSGHTNEFGGPIAEDGFDYDVTLADGNVATGSLLQVIGANLRADESLRFDGRAETDGSLRILSGAGTDTLFGGSGADTLYGGLGADSLDGGAGADFYLYRSAAESTAAARDTIVFGTGDRIDLSLVDAIDGTPANEAFGFIGANAFGHTAGELRAYDGGAGQWFVEGDVNGDGAADFVLAVTSAAPLVANDFIL